MTDLLFEKDFKLIKTALTDSKIYERHCACSILINNNLRNYNKIEDKHTEELNELLIRGKSDVWTYRVLCVLDFKNYNFKNIEKLVKSYRHKKFFKCLEFLKYKNGNFYRILKIITPDLLKDELFVEDETLTSLYRHFNKIGMDKLENKFYTLKRMLEEEEPVSENRKIDLLEFHEIVKSEDTFELFLFTYENTKEVIFNYFKQHFNYWDFLEMIKKYLEEVGYTENVTFSQIKPNEKTRNLVNALLCVGEEITFYKPYLIRFFNHVKFVSKENVVKNSTFDLLINKEYVKLRKEIDRDDNVKIFIKEFIEDLFRQIDDKKGLLFLKFLLNRNMIDSDIIMKNYLKIKNKTIRQELINHLKKIEKDIKISTEKLEMNSTESCDKYYVYFFYKDNQLLYVGKTYNMKNRFAGHKRDSVFFREITDIKYGEFLSENEASIYEIYYIDQLNPIYNSEFNKSKGLSFMLPERKIKIYKEKY